MSDAIAGVVWLALNLMMARNLWAIARRHFPNDSVLQNFTHVIVGMWTTILAICLVLGAMGSLTPTWVMSSTFVIASLMTVLLRSRNNGQRVHDQAEKSGDRLRTPSCCLSGWMVISALIIVSLIFRGVLVFPHDWDSLMYHIPLIDHWLQGGSLYAPACAAWYFPGNFELIGFWLVAPFSGDFYVGLASLPGAFLFVSGMLELGRQFGFTAPLRNAIALATIATEVFSRQIATSENDIAVAGLFISGVAYGIRAIESCRWPDMVMVAATLGILPGVKYYALGYTVSAWLALVILCLKRNGLKESARMMTFGVLAALCLSGYWYFRNFILTGTPLYPMGFSERTNSLDGLRMGSLSTSLLANGRPGRIGDWILAVWRKAGPCHAIAVLGMPLTLAWLIVGRSIPVISSGRTASPSHLRWFLAILIIISLFVFSITPNTVMPNSEGRRIFGYLSVRFSLCPISLAAIAMCVTSADLTRWLSAGSNTQSRYGRFIASVPTSFIIVLAAVQCAFQLPPLLGTDPVLVVLLAADLVGLLFFASVYLKMGSIRRVLMGSLIVGSAVTSTFLGYQWHNNFAGHYDDMFDTKVFTYLNNIEKPYPQVGVIDYRYYPFFGSRRQFVVTRPAKILSKQTLLAYIDAHTFDIVAIERFDNPTAAGRYRGSGDWARQVPQILRPLFTGKNFDVYKVSKQKMTQ